MERERFNFIRDVWNNQRRAVRATGTWSMWYRMLYALTILLTSLAKRAEWLYNQIWLESSDAYGLTLWGQRYGIVRNRGESDSEYRHRMLYERTIAGGDSTNATRRKILNAICRVPTESISINRVYDYHLTVGGVNDRGDEAGHVGAVGSVVATRDYAMFAYRIYAPLPPEWESSIAKAIKLLSETNVGGNYWELWFEGTSDSGTRMDKQMSAYPAQPDQSYVVF